VNPGTVPLESEKLFEAIRGNGSTAPLVMLRFESHGAPKRTLPDDSADQAKIAVHPAAARI